MAGNVTVEICVTVGESAVVDERERKIDFFFFFVAQDEGKANKQKQKHTCLIRRTDHEE